MKVVFISQRLGNNVCSKIHLKAFEKIVSKEDLLILDLNPNEKARIEENHVFMGKFSIIEKVEWALQQTTWFLTNKRINEICDYINNFKADVIFIDDSCLGKIAKKIKEKKMDVKVITFYHDIISDLYPQLNKANDFKFKVLMYHAAIKGEILSEKFSDKNLVLNERDARLYQNLYKRNPDELLPMAVADPDLFELHAAEFDFDAKKKQNKKIILFVGAYYKPNIEGLKWFVDNVFKFLGNNYLLLVVGRKLEMLCEDYTGESNILILGGVEKLAPFYNNADVVVAPIFSGGGMKQKTAEAFAYGKTFIGTTESMQGYENTLNIIENNHNIVFSGDSPEEQIQAFEYIEKNQIYGFHEVLNNTFKENYSIEAIENRLCSIIGIEKRG